MEEFTFDLQRFMSDRFIMRTDGDDEYQNTLQYATVAGLGGNDSIRNSKSNVSISGGAGKDTIYNSLGAASTLDGGDDDDLIQNWGANVSINSGNGNDHVFDAGSLVTIMTGDGSDSVRTSVSASQVKIFTGVGNDTIQHAGYLSTIDAGVGNDRISIGSSSGNNLILYSEGDGADYVQNFHADDMLVIGGGTGTYTSQKSGSAIVVNVGEGSISLVGAANLSTVNIKGIDKTPVDNPRYQLLTPEDNNHTNTLHGATIIALAGNDELTNTGDSVTIDGGSGNDTIVSYGQSVTVFAGKDDDNISFRGDNAIFNLVQYNEGHGNDYITGFDVTDTLVIGGGTGTYYTVQSGNDLLIGVGDSTITLAGGKNLASRIDGVRKAAPPVSKSITLTAGDDKRSNTINGATIAALGGNDSIYNSGSGASISGDAGNDTINNDGLQVTINAGTGNDRISLGSISTNDLIEYASGDGNDTVYSFNASSTLKIGNGTTDTYSKATVDNDIIITVGDGSILLKDAANLDAVNVAGTESKPTNSLDVKLDDNDNTYENSVEGATIQAFGGKDSIYNSADSVSIDAGAGNDTISNSGASVTIDGGAGDDEIIINYGSNVTINGGAGDDNIGYNLGSNVIIDGGAGNDTIANNGDNVTIDGGNGNDKIWNNSDNVTIDGGDGNDSIDNNGDSVTISGGKGNDTITTFASNREKSLIEYTSGDGNDLILGFNATSTLKIGGGTGTYSTTKSGNNLFVCVGNDTITLVGAASLAGNIVGSLKTYTPATPASNKITLTANADTYINSIEGATILALGGDDNLLNAFTGVSIDAGAGNDSITNFNDSVTIDAGAGNDSVTNFNDSVTIDGMGGKDYIGNGGTNVSISGGDGNDTIINNGSTVTIDGGAGDDSIYNGQYGDNVTIDGGDGDDSIDNGGSNVSIDGGDGDDSIDNYGDSVSIDGGLGNDQISLHSYAEKTLIEYADGDGKDTVEGFGGDDTLKIGNGTTDTYSKATVDNDIIVTVGDGSVLLKDAATLSTVNIAGTETVADNPSVLSGIFTEGNDTYTNTVDAVALLALGGDDSVTNSGASVTIDGMGGNDYISNGGTNVSISGGAGNDEIHNGGVFDSINGGDGNDDISNNYFNNTIDGGTGNDTIANTGSNVSIDGGDGNDTIENYSYNVTISGGAGNDTINNLYASSVSIDGGNGDDSINNDSSNVSIDGGTGNDTISLSSDAENNLIEHTSGDGNDFIVGFNADDTLQIGGGTGTYSTTKSGNNLFVCVGNDTITLIDAASLAGNIQGDLRTYTPVTSASKKITLTPNADAYVNSIEGATILALGGDDNLLNAFTKVSIDAGAGNDTVTNFNDSVTVNGGAGNDSILNGGVYDSLSEEHSKGYANVSISGGDGNDSITNGGSDVTIDGGDGDDSIYNSKFGNSVTISGGVGDDSIANISSEVTIGGGDGNDSIFNNGKNNTINGGDGDDSIKNYGKNNTINGGDGDDTIRNDLNYTISGDSVSIDGGAGNDFIANSGGDSVTITGGTGNDTITLSSGAKNNLIQYTSGDGNDFIVGFNADDTLKIGGGTGTYSTTKSGNNLFVCVGNDTITLVGAASLAGNIQGDIRTYTPVTSASKKITLTANADTYENSIEGATILALGGNDNLLNAFTNVSIDAGTGNDTVTNYNDSVTVNGGTGNDYIYNSKFGNSVTISGSVGNDTIKNYGAEVAIDGGDGDDAIINSGSNVFIDGGDGDDTISNDGNDFNLGVIIDGGNGNDRIYNQDGVYVSIDGGNGDDYIYNYMGQEVSISGGAGDDLIRNQDGLYVSIAGGDGNDYIENSAGYEFTIDGGAGNDTISLSYSYARETVIKYASGDGNDTVKGFDSDDTLQIGGGSGTYSTQQSGDDIIVTVGDGSILLKDAATLEVVNIAGEEGTPADNWTLADGVAKYKNLFTLSGINPNLTVDELDAAITIDGNKIILSADALGKSNVTLTTTGNYSLALDDDCPTVTATEKGWTLDGTTATYRDAGKSDGYRLSTSKTVTYTAAVGGKALLTVKGLVDGLTVNDGAIDGLSIDGKVLTVTPDVVGENFSVGSGYKVVFDEGNYGDSKFTGTTGRDTLEVNGSGLQIEGGKGNDTITSNVNGNTYLFAANGGKDVLVGYGDDDTVKITDDSQTTVTVKNSDIIVKAGNATMTLKDAATGKHLTVVDVNDDALVDKIFYADRTVDDDGATLTAAFNEKSFAADGLAVVDGSAVSRKFSLTGGDEDNTLIGGKGANFINGGGGDNELTGGSGNDTFAVGHGVDVITDYGNGTDKISLAADVAGFEVEGDDVIISFGDEKSVTISDGAGKKIYFLQNGRSTTEIFETDGKLSTNGKSITLASATTNYEATDAIVTIDGSLTDGVKIFGNDKNNKIFGGEGSDILNGSAGKDTFTGGDGSDIFIFESGKDVITDYTIDDKISLTAATTSETLNSKGDVILKFGTDSLTIKKVDDTDGRTIVFAGDSEDTTKTYFSERIVGDDGVTLQSNFSATTFSATKDLPKVDAAATKVLLTLAGGDEGNTLIGGTKANVLDGGKGNDILIGNGGNDTFVYSAGDDTISDYESRDKISLTSAIQSYDLDGDDVIIGFGDGSLTIADAANSSVTFVETSGATQLNVFASEGIFNGKQSAVTLNAATESYTAPTNIVSIDGGLVTGEIEIVGNAKANHIHAGDFGSTLNGGAKNDSLWGGAGNDTFIYESGGGQDVIYGFGDGDALQLEGKFTASFNGDDILFKVGSVTNAVTLKDYSATTFNVNGDMYQISGSNFVKKD